MSRAKDKFLGDEPAIRPPDPLTRFLLFLFPAKLAGKGEDKDREGRLRAPAASSGSSPLEFWNIL